MTVFGRLNFFCQHFFAGRGKITALDMILTPTAVLIIYHIFATHQVFIQGRIGAPLESFSSQTILAVGH